MQMSKEWVNKKQVAYCGEIVDVTE